ncbi:MAG: hypothetical protein V7767_02120 [Leeuwenhoekiella sp.]
MRNKIFMYLFFFAALLVVFQYANEKKIFESKEREITKLKTGLSNANDSIMSLNDEMMDANYFSLSHNENAYTYFEKYNVEVDSLSEKITNEIISNNSVSGNPLIPYDNAIGVFRINKVKVLNHKWIIADFSDGKRWGELLLRYDIDANNAITFENLQSLIYPQGN